MANPITDGQVSRIVSKFSAIVQRVKMNNNQPGKLDGHQVTEAFEAILQGKFVSDQAVTVHQKQTLVHGLWLPVDEQVKMVSAWNDQFGWGLEKALADLGNAPSFTDNHLQPVVLEIRLPPEKKIGGVQRTFDNLWKLITSKQKDFWRWQMLLFDKEHLRHYDKSDYQPGLSWRLLDVSANRDKSVQWVWDNQQGSFPAEAIMSLAAMHPAWIKAMNGNEVPYVSMAGYEVYIPGFDRWQSSPNLYFSQTIGQVRLSANVITDHGDDWSVPVFVGE